MLIAHNEDDLQRMLHQFNIPTRKFNMNFTRKDKVSGCVKESAEMQIVSRGQNDWPGNRVQIPEHHSFKSRKAWDRSRRKIVESKQR